MKQLKPPFSRTHRGVLVARVVFLVLGAAGFVFTALQIDNTSKAFIKAALPVPNSDIATQHSGIHLSVPRNPTLPPVCTTDPIVVSNADSGAGSLRQAIIDACAGSNITFNMTMVTSPITLTTAALSVNKNLTITGPGSSLLTIARSTAGGTPNFRIITISGASNSPTVTILGLTLSNGNVTGTFPAGGGGGIYNERGTLVVIECVISGNTATAGGGIRNLGTLTLSKSTVSGNTGGGIYNNVLGGSTANPTTVFINDSLISGNNSSGGGAGIDNGVGTGGTATVTINNSTISANNNSGSGGGGIHNAAVFSSVTSNSTATITINNSTISGNNATVSGNGGGIYNISSGEGCTATTTITNGTVSGNNASGSSGSSGGIYISIFNSSAPVVLRNTIVAGNFRNSGSTTSDISGIVDAASSFNLIGDGTGMSGITNGNNGNQVGTSGSPIDPRVSPLADNGGPTLTHALISGSSAIDAGNNSAITNPPFTGPPFTDQRGGSFTRIADGDGNASAIVDIGAYELQGILTIDKVKPPAGRTSGGQQIVMAGGFANLSTITMGGAAASWVYTNGAADTSSITVTTPAHAIGAVQIDLTPTSGSPYSKANGFAYLPTVFTDDSLVVGVTTVKAQHILELRQAVDAMRAVAGSSAAPWTDPALAPGGTIRAIHILDLRTYLDDAATRLGYSTSAYTDPALPTGYPIKRVHIEELRQRIRVIAG